MATQVRMKNSSPPCSQTRISSSTASSLKQENGLKHFLHNSGSVEELS